MTPSNVFGLIAGSGDLPLAFASQANRKGYRLHTVAIRGSASPKLEKMSEKILWITPSQIGKMLSFFKKNGVNRTVMHGKVQHSSVYQNLRLDLRFFVILAGLKDLSGETILKALAQQLLKNGTRLVDSRFLMEEFLPKAGWVCGQQSDRTLLETIRFGLRRARVLSREKIGQTLVVKKSAVVAVEAMEGTDETIRRAGKCAGTGIVVVKVASPDQDWRFDVPTVGPLTLRTMAAVRARGLVLVSGQAFLLDREKTILEAKRNGIFIYITGR